MNIHGREFDAARDRVGDLAQLVRIDRLIADDGPARGSRLLRLVSGGAFEVELHPDRALDIGRVTYRGIPIAWLSPTGIAAPGLAEPLGDGWVRTWGGGLLSTVGLDSFGAAGADGGEEFGTHGRIGAQPAALIRTEITDDALLVEAEMRQATAFGDTLRLVRRITVPIGSSTITVDDTVINDGPDPVEWMILYHVNLGWPLLDALTSVHIPTAGGDPPIVFGDPIEVFTEVGTQYVLREGFDTVTVRNDDLDLTFSLQYSTTTLPWLNTWRLAQRRRYVMAIEPSNTPSLAGRVGARETGDLPRLASGERVSMHLRISLS